MSRHARTCHLSRLRASRHWVLLAAMFFGAAAPGSAQTDGDALLAWAREDGIRLSSIEPGTGFMDLQDIRPLLESARLVALGETTHGIHEFLALRNRLFEFLVEELGFTAIAVETGFTEGLAVDQYVQGGSSEVSLAGSVFSWVPPRVWAENQWLIEWMREYNSRPSTVRRIRFYGIDLSGGRWGQLREPRIAADSALSYLARVEATLAARAEHRLEALLSRFNEIDYPTLDATDRDALAGGLADLVSIFERERPRFIAATGEWDYDVAHRQAVVALKVVGYLRALTATPNDNRERDSARDEAMAANVRWVMEREGDTGRVMLFAHNWHVMKSSGFADAYPENYPGLGPTGMGEYLQMALGDDMVVVGTAFGSGEGALDGTYQQADPGSIDGLLGRVGPPIIALNLNSPSISQVVRNEFKMYPKLRVSDRFGELDLLAALDVLVYVDKVSPARSGAVPHQ